MTPNINNPMLHMKQKPLFTKEPLFIHIPKTGGMSVKRTLGINNWNHIKLTRISNVEHYFSFSFVRNPWDRMVSFYHYFKLQVERNFGNARPNVNAILASKTNGFGGFCASVENSNIEDTVWPKHPDSYGALMKPQSWWLKDHNGNLGVDFIGKFENLDDDFSKVCEITGIDKKPLSRHNRSSHKPYREYYNTDVRNIVGRIYREDIENFKYSF